jgi:hypothetical protein
LGEIKVENGRRIITVKPGKDRWQRGMLYAGARMRSWWMVGLSDLVVPGISSPVNKP